jgi:CubicO group peptidase (beta-lactamase class C family)
VASWLAPLAVAALIVAVCSADGPRTEGTADHDLRAVELGFDPAALEDIAAQAAGDSHCLVVTRHGRVAGEWYWNGHTADEPETVFSVTQAVVSTLVGIAQDEGYLDIDDPVSDYVPQWAGTSAEHVTIRNLLDHTSGRESTLGLGNRALYNALLSAEDPAGFAIALDQVALPGTVWDQNLPAFEVLNPVLRRATGIDPAAYAQQKLFGPLGMRHSTMGKSPSGYTWMHSFMQSTGRDMVRLGYLYLRNGSWGGHQVISEQWVSAATHPSQDLNAGFGYQWWLNRPGSLVSMDNITAPDYDAARPGLQLLPDAPEDMYWSIGAGGMFVQIDPRTDTVVVRLGEGPTSRGGRGEATNAGVVTRIVTDALEPSAAGPVDGG